MTSTSASARFWHQHTHGGAQLRTEPQTRRPHDQPESSSMKTRSRRLALADGARGSSQCRPPGLGDDGCASRSWEAPCVYARKGPTSVPARHRPY